MPVGVVEGVVERVVVARQVEHGRPATPAMDLEGEVGAVEVPPQSRLEAEVGATREDQEQLVEPVDPGRQLARHPQQVVAVDRVPDVLATALAVAHAEGPGEGRRGVGRGELPLAVQAGRPPRRDVDVLLDEHDQVVLGLVQAAVEALGGAGHLAVGQQLVRRPGVEDGGGQQVVGQLEVVVDTRDERDRPLVGDGHGQVGCDVGDDVGDQHVALRSQVVRGALGVDAQVPHQRRGGLEQGGVDRCRHRLDEVGGEARLEQQLERRRVAVEVLRLGRGVRPGLGGVAAEQLDQGVAGGGVEGAAHEPPAWREGRVHAAQLGERVVVRRERAPQGGGAELLGDPRGRVLEPGDRALGRAHLSGRA